MPTKMGLPKYFKYSDCKPGDVLVEKAEFTGTTEGTYGAQFNFIEVDTGQHIVLNKAGQFEWRLDQGHMVPGEVFRITYLGKEKIERGTFAGKDANKFEIEKYEDHELPEAWLKKRRAAVGAAIGAAVGAGSPSPAPVAAAAVKTAEAEALDDLS